MYAVVYEKEKWNRQKSGLTGQPFFLRWGIGDRPENCRLGEKQNVPAVRKNGIILHNYNFNTDGEAICMFLHLSATSR